MAVTNLKFLDFPKISEASDSIFCCKLAISFPFLFHNKALINYTINNVRLHIDCSSSLKIILGSSELITMGSLENGHI